MLLTQVVQAGEGYRFTPKSTVQILWTRNLWPPMVARQHAIQSPYTIVRAIVDFLDNEGSNYATLRSDARGVRGTDDTYRGRYFDDEKASSAAGSL